MLSNDDMLPSRQTSEIIKTCHLGGGMLYVQGAIWGRGLVAFCEQKATKPRPQRLHTTPVPKWHLLSSLKMKISRINKKILHGRNGII